MSLILTGRENQSSNQMTYNFRYLSLHEVNACQDYDSGNVAKIVLCIDPRKGNNSMNNLNMSLIVVLATLIVTHIVIA